MKRMGPTVITIGCLYAAMLWRAPASARGQSAADETRIVATVGGEPVLAGEVQRRLEKLTAGQEVNPAVLPALQTRVLGEIIDRRLVLAYARRTQSGAGPAEVDAALEEFTSGLAARGVPLEAFLQEKSMAAEDLRRQISWHLTYQKYAVRYFTEARLESYFEAHRRRFDGTQLSVSHILLRGESGDTLEQWDELVQRANTIRRQITSGEMAFAEAAEKYSDGPSAADGGRLGLIGRDGPMVEAFSRAAFALQVGQMSGPVRTSFGVHLIRCDQIKPGNKRLSDVRHRVERLLARNLIEKLTGLERCYTPVEFPTATPHTPSLEPR